MKTYSLCALLLCSTFVSFSSKEREIITKPFDEMTFFKKIVKSIDKTKSNFGRSGNLTKVS